VYWIHLKALISLLNRNYNVILFIYLDQYKNDRIDHRNRNIDFPGNRYFAHNLPCIPNETCVSDILLKMLFYDFTHVAMHVILFLRINLLRYTVHLGPYTPTLIQDQRVLDRANY